MSLLFEIWSVASINQIKSSHNGDEVTTVAVDMLENVDDVPSLCPNLHQH
jgi:hypothetical protein